MIAFTCGGCGKAFRVDDSLAGRKSRCTACGTTARIAELEVVMVPLESLPKTTSSAPPPAPRKSTKKRKPRQIERDAWISLAIGLGLAVIALAIPLLGFIVHVLTTVIHESGHVATAWLFGSPALPSFDLAYGGGVSYTFARQPILILIVYGIFAIMAFRNRDDKSRLITLIGAILLYSIAVFSPIRDCLITAMGHGAELIIAGVFLYRALSGRDILRGAERPLYAFLGLYVVLYDTRMAYELITSPEHRQIYADAKGGGHWMDFSRIAKDHLHVRLEVVATLFLITCTLPPLAAFMYHRFRGRSN